MHEKTVQNRFTSVVLVFSGAAFLVFYAQQVGFYGLLVVAFSLLFLSLIPAILSAFAPVKAFLSTKSTGLIIKTTIFIKNFIYKRGGKGAYDAR